MKENFDLKGICVLRLEPDPYPTLRQQPNPDPSFFKSRIRIRDTYNEDKMEQIMIDLRKLETKSIKTFNGKTPPKNNIYKFIFKFIFTIRAKENVQYIREKNMYPFYSKKMLCNTF